MGSPSVVLLILTAAVLGSAPVYAHGGGTDPQAILPEDATPEYNADFIQALEVPGIRAALENGTIRPATPADIDAWVRTAKAAKRDVAEYSPTSSAVFLVQRPFTLPSLDGHELQLSYFIAPRVAFPRGSLWQNTIYVIETGDWVTSGQYEDSTGVHFGTYPLAAPQ